jgi:hypothetical protein
MSQTVATVFSGVGVGFSANASIRAGSAAKQAGDYNAHAIIDEAGYNAKVAEYNAKVADLQAQDAINRGNVAESTVRANTAQKVGETRASYGAQGVNVDVGSPVDVVQAVARGGAVDAMTVKLDAAREAWGYKTVAANDTAQAAAITNKGTVDAWNARQGGMVARNANRARAAAEIIGGAGTLIRQRYGARKP